MRELIACSAFAVTITLAVGRPRIGRTWRVGPASASLASVLLLLAAGIIGPADIAAAAAILWRPFITIVSIMVVTAAAQRLGVVECLARMSVARPDLPAEGLLLRVFLLSAATASLLNNDAAVLLLTPVVITLVRARYPSQPRLLVPFVFVVFMAAGVAPLVVSNPMNMIVASYAGLDFNAYAASMLPVAVLGWVLSFALLRRLFATDLAMAPDHSTATAAPPKLHARHWQMLAVLMAVLGSYPVIAAVDGSLMWLVSAAGAALALLLAWRHERIPPDDLLARGVAWDVLCFLPAVFMLASGLRNVGLVDLLASVYSQSGVGVIGATAALGSAVLNNHPMAMINMLALEAAPSAGDDAFLAALVGGDLGPRLLPIGSLAGLLWIESCRRMGVEIPLGQFVGVGAVLTVPTLALSLLLLALL